jgi:capsular exopolysaccharide synthesis family protein
MLTSQTVRLDPAPKPAPEIAPAPRPADVAAAPPAPLPRALSRPYSLRGLVRALRRRWLVALAAGLVLGAAAGYAAYALVPTERCTARARIQVTPASASDGGCPDNAIPAQIKSRADRGGPVENELSVAWDGCPGVLAVQTSGDRPEELAALVNSVAAAAVRDLNAADTQARGEQLDRLEKSRAELEKTVALRRRNLDELTRRAGDDASRRTVRLVLAATALGDRHAELRRVQSDRRAAEAQLMTAARPPEPPPKPAEPRVSFDDMMKSDPDLKPLMTQIADLNGQIAQFTALYKDNPERAKKAIEERGLQTKLDALYSQAHQQYEKKHKAIGGPAKSEPPRPEVNPNDGLKTRIASYEAAEQSLAREIRDLEANLDHLQSDCTEIDNLRREIGGLEAAAQETAAALDRAQHQLRAAPRATLLEEAAVPPVPADRRLPLAGLAGLGAFALGLVGVGLAEQRRRKLHTAADVVEGLELPVIGTQALVPADCNPLAPAAGKSPWYASANDGVDGVRGLLMPPVPPAVARVVTVVSAVGGEGCSVLAAQLAASLARAGRRTLLLDANLRRPALHRAFDLAQAPGLAEVLRGETALPAAIRPAPAERLWVLPAGTADPRALQALARESTAALLERLKKDYEYIVIDGAPVLACADTLMLAQRSDAVVVSVLAGVSGLPAVSAAWRRLSLLGARPLGIVMQGAPGDEPARLRYRLAQR